MSMQWRDIGISPLGGDPMKTLEQYNRTLNNYLRYHFANLDLGSTGDLSANTLSASSATIGQLGSTGSITANTLTASSGNFGKIFSSSGTIGQLSSTGAFTLNTFSASSGTVGQLGSTGSITANILTASSGNIGQLGSTGSITANTFTASSGTFTYVKGSCSTFGNSTSYSHFEADGTLEFVGDSRTYRDELGDITKLKVVGTAITDDSTDCTVNYSTQSALTSFQYCNVQLNHDRDLSGNLYPHIHWLQSSGNSPNFLLAYRYLANCSTATDWTYLKCNTVACVYVSGTLHQKSYTTQAITPPANSTISDILQFKIYRDVANASTVFSSTDDYSLPAKVLSFDVHLISNTIGSRTELSK